MEVLQVEHEFMKGEGGIYCIHYQDKMDLDFNDVESVVYVGSTRDFKRRFKQHQKDLKGSHPNSLLKRVSKSLKRNGQGAVFNKYLMLPRNGLTPQQYDRVIKAVEHWLIVTFKSTHDIEADTEVGDCIRHRVANLSLPFRETAENGHNLSILLSSYANTLEDGALRAILNASASFWGEFEWGDW
ncbi:hypothetical protein CGK32_22740 [Vibrio parahaemolyticus]|uniref:GIY-YIG nuclease family protein n=1 Tax=Vibrio parahaemolyticus TaxID=670 RepID=UPI00116C7B70|nr:GIY-YIG nuclease family protein [Vibrio parahaemolyticus]TOA18434.1 hypothetical protein CGK32_22740 [Vibrio parahaemolyticus]